MSSLPHILLTAAQLFFSIWHILSSIALKNRGANPLIFSFYREAFGSLCMLLYVVFIEKSIIFIRKEDRLRFLVMGILSFINVVGTIYSLSYIPPTLYSLFQPTIPCLSAILSILVGLEVFSVLKGCGILTAIGGALLVEISQFIKQEHDNNNNTTDTSATNNSTKYNNILLGTFLVILQCFAVSALIVIQKTMLDEHYSPGMLVFVYYSIGSFLTLILLLIYITSYGASEFALNYERDTWLTLVYATIFPTFLAYNICKYTIMYVCMYVYTHTTSCVYAYVHSTYMLLLTTLIYITNVYYIILYYCSYCICQILGPVSFLPPPSLPYTPPYNLYLHVLYHISYYILYLLLMKYLVVYLLLLVYL